MKTTIYLASQFREQFAQCGRKDQFSYEGLGLLFDYFEEYEGATGEELELDVISVCCDYTEETVEGIADAYGLELPEDETGEEHRQAVRDYLNDHTTIVGETPSGFVYANF